MLRGISAYEQAERSKIEDVVGSEWMQKYGMPAIRALAEQTTQDQDHQITEEVSDLSSSPRTPSSPPSSTTLSDENAVPEIKDLDIILPSTVFTKGLPTPRASLFYQYHHTYPDHPRRRRRLSNPCRGTAQRNRFLFHSSRFHLPAVLYFPSSFASR